MIEKACLLHEYQKIHKPRHRIDIQWLRAIAILSVLIFHLDSNLLKNGYLGVDMFFVISGYLMSCILNYSSRKELSLELLKTFYSRRIKRIIPLYLSTVLLTLVICSFYIFEFDYDKLKADTVWAVGYLTNIHSIMNHDNYFINIHDFKFLLHTWSLSVEIQYYLISPFLLYLIYKSGKPIFLTALVMATSLTFQGMNLKNTSLTFGFLFSRICQFMVGTLVHYMNKNSDNNGLSDKTRKRSYCAALSLLILTLILPNNRHLIRLIITVLTGILIYFGNVMESESILLKFLAYFGDMSYSIYLIHWPIITLIKYHLLHYGYYIILYGVIIVLISALHYNFVERRIIVASNTSIFTIISLQYLLIFIVLLLPHGFGIKDNTSTPPHIKTNQNLIKGCIDYIKDWTKCESDLPFGIKSRFICLHNGNGNGTIMVTGNSFATFQSAALIDQLKGKYDKLYLVTRASCTIFAEYNDPKWNCDSIMNHISEIMNLIKPDVTIVIQRLSLKDYALKLPLKSFDEAKTDKITDRLRKYWEEYSQHTKQIIIVEPHATFPDKPIASMIKLLRENQDLDDYYISEEDWDKEIDPGWWRMQASIDKCKVCSTVSIKKHFCHAEDRKCDIYDRETKFTLYCDAGHSSLIGSNRIITDVVSQISDKFIY